MKIIKKILFLIFTMMIILTNSFTSYASETPLDGNYKVEITFTGGTGKVTAKSPTDLTVSDKKITAKIILTSSSYTYMVVDGNKYYNTAAPGENSTFIIPISALDSEIKITACTEAMSSPHEIDYIIKLSSQGTISSKDNGTKENTEKNTSKNPSENIVNNTNDNKNNTSNDVKSDTTKEISKDTKSEKSNVTSNNTENANKNEEIKTEDITAENEKKETTENNTGEEINDSTKVQGSSSKSILDWSKVIIIIIVLIAAIIAGIMFKKRKK